MINTARGQISLVDAVQYVREHPTKTADVVGTLRQFQEKNHGWEARFVARYVLAHSDQYDGKVVRRAQEIEWRILLGPRKCRSVDDVGAMIGDFTPGTKLKLTLQKRMPRLAAMTVLSLADDREMILLPEDERALMMAVSLSGEWGFSNCNVVNATILNRFNRVAFIQRIARVIDTIEVVSAPEHMPDEYEQECHGLLQEYADMWFDRQLFDEVCDQQGFTLEKERIVYLAAEPMMIEVLELFSSVLDKRDFLRAYAKAFTVATGG